MKIDKIEVECAGIYKVGIAQKKHTYLCIEAEIPFDSTLSKKLVDGMNDREKETMQKAIEESGHNEMEVEK